MRAGAVTIVALAALLGLLPLRAPGDGEVAVRRAADATPAPPRQTPEAVPLRRMLGTMVMAAMPGTRPSASFLRRVRAGRIGGVILFAENVASARTLRSTTHRLQHAARAGGSAGLLIAIDQEGGVVKRLPGPPGRSPPAIGATGSSAVARHEARATGRYLRGLGINVDLAPVVDVARGGSVMASRSFGRDPGRVARLATAFARGLAAARVGATAKHFPGLGAATRNTDTSGAAIELPLEALRRDGLPFRRAIGAGIPLVMVSNAVYPAFGSRLPATLSKPIATGELRDRLGFGGVVISDDLEAAAVSRVAPPGRAAVAAARAGVDVVLLAGSPAASSGAYWALVRAARRGQLSRDAVRASYERIQGLARQLGP